MCFCILFYYDKRHLAHILKGKRYIACAAPLKCLRFGVRYITVRCFYLLHLICPKRKLTAMKLNRTAVSRCNVSLVASVYLLYSECCTDKRTSVLRIYLSYGKSSITYIPNSDCQCLTFGHAHRLCLCLYISVRHFRLVECVLNIRV